MDPKFYTQLYGNTPSAALLRNDYAAQLGDASTIWRKTKNATHEILNAGAALPITSGAVSAIRGVTNLFSWGTKASTETDSAIDAAARAIKANKIKTALLVTAAAGGVGYLIYRSGKKKRSRR